MLSMFPRVHRAPVRSTSLPTLNTCALEPLERRSMLAVTISGSVLRDVTGNGLSADDQPLSGVVVKLFRDLNANGQVDSSDGAAIASRTSAAGTGAFSFTGLSGGRYVLKENVPSSQVRTAPVLSSSIAINAGNPNGAYGNNIFANYVKAFDASALSNITFTINGAQTVTSLVGNVPPGATVKANFTVAAGKTVTLSLVSYTASGPNGGNLELQRVFDSKTATFSAGNHSLSIDVPNCFFQVDFVGGPVIDRFGPAGSNIRYTPQGRLMAFGSGGTTTCVTPPPPPPPPGETTGAEGLTPGFWKNHTNVWSPTGLSTSQTLESIFNVPDSLGLDNVTLLGALNLGGGPGVKGAAQNLFRHAVAALLNARHPSVDYALTSSQIITRVNSALASGSKSTIETLKNQLDDFNNGDGGLDAHGRAT